MTEIFSSNFPNSSDELTARLKSIERCINNDEKLRQVNVEFCRRAFRLLADCGLITEDNVQFLSDAVACESYDRNLKFPYNRSEGVLRKVERADDIYDANHIQRFYHGDKFCVICNETKYLIANNWFTDGGGLPSNKRAFYNWLALQTRATVR